MVFKIDMAIALSLIALVSGMLLLIKSWKEELCCKAFVKIIAYIVVVVSLLLFLCSSYHGVLLMAHKYMWNEKGAMMHEGMMREGGGMMMHQMMKECPMMKMKMMEEEQKHE
jgi:hypothetical protein